MTTVLLLSDNVTYQRCDSAPLLTMITCHKRSPLVHRCALSQSPTPLIFYFPYLSIRRRVAALVAPKIPHPPQTSSPAPKVLRVRSPDQTFNPHSHPCTMTSPYSAILFTELTLHRPFLRNRLHTSKPSHRDGLLDNDESSLITVAESSTKYPQDRHPLGLVAFWRAHLCTPWRKARRPQCQVRFPCICQAAPVRAWAGDHRVFGSLEPRRGGR